MATNGIATRANANTIVAGTYAANTGRCVTYASIDATGLFNITPAYSGKYTNATNRLVLTSELSARPKARILFKINDFTTKNLSTTVSSITVRGLEVQYPETLGYVTIPSISFPKPYFTTGEIVLSKTDLGTYTFNTSEATATIFLSDGTSFEGTCDFTQTQMVQTGNKIHRQSINAVQGNNYLTLSVRGRNTNNTSNPNTVQFKVRLLFSLIAMQVYSFKIGIGNWIIRNSSGTVLSSGALPTTEYYPHQLPTINDSTGGMGQDYYYIDLYTSASVTNIPANEPYYISINAPIFQYRPNNLSFIQGNITVVNDLTINTNYGYKLLDSSTDTIKHIKLDCSSSI